MPSCSPADDRKPTIIFVHGMLGFDAIVLPGISIHYFRQLAQSLSFSGADILFARLPMVGRIVERAEHLKNLVARTRSKRIILVAHSMGGLDCRYLIQHLDPDRRVRILVTVGTPHHGTPLADWFIQEKSWVAHLGKAITRPAIEDLTLEACTRFNTAVPNRPDVRYLSYAGCRPIAEMPLPLRPFCQLLHEASGVNDGEVPLISAQWGEFRGVLRADHVELVGWSFARPDRETRRPFDHIAFYRKVVQEILSLG